MKLIFLLYVALATRKWLLVDKFFNKNGPRTKIVVEVKLHYHANIYLLIMLKV